MVIIDQCVRKEQSHCFFLLDSNLLLLVQKNEILSCQGYQQGCSCHIDRTIHLAAFRYLVIHIPFAFAKCR